MDELILYYLFSFLLLICVLIAIEYVGVYRLNSGPVMKSNVKFIPQLKE